MKRYFAVTADNVGDQVFSRTTLRTLLKLLVLVLPASPLYAVAGGFEIAALEPPAALHLPSFVPAPTYTSPDEAASVQNADAFDIAPSKHDKYGAFVDRAAREYGVDPALIHAIIRTESAHQPAAVSPKGAIGLMQVMPQTAARFGKVDLFDPEQNIRTGTRYLRTLQELFKDRLDLVLAAYNAGEQVVARLGRIPPYPETQAYVNGVTKLYNQYRAAAMALR